MVKLSTMSLKELGGSPPTGWDIKKVYVHLVLVLTKETIIYLCLQEKR